jgi:1-pyrroline-4-hydroxy-2-carboxylate deaminase
MTFSWQGVFPAIITPFRSDDSLDLAMFEQNLRAQLSSGVDGIIIGGSLGEASTLTTDEKRQLSLIARAVGGPEIPLIVNIAENATREALAQAALAASWDADGLMLLPPMRYKSDDRETVEYFRAIASSTELPIMIYNNPVDYKIDVTIDMFSELIHCPNITAVKESTRDVTNVTRLRNKFGDRLSILCGVDTLALEELLLGADGWVAGLVNAFPKETVAIYRLAKAGRIAEATAIYRWFMPLLELDIHPKLVQYIKLASEITGIGTEHVRAPRLPLEGAERERILHIILEGVRSRPNLPADGWN